MSSSSADLEKLHFFISARKWEELRGLLIKDRSIVNKHGISKNIATFYAIREPDDRSVMDIDIFKMLLELVDDINHSNIYGETMLIHAAKVRNYDVINILLDNGADYKLKDSFGNDVESIISKHIKSDAVNSILSRISAVQV